MQGCDLEGDDVPAACSKGPDDFMAHRVRGAPGTTQGTRGGPTGSSAAPGLGLHPPGSSLEHPEVPIWSLFTAQDLPLEQRGPTPTRAGGWRHSRLEWCLWMCNSRAAAEAEGEEEEGRLEGRSNTERELEVPLPEAKVTRDWLRLPGHVSLQGTLGWCPLPPARPGWGRCQGWEGHPSQGQGLLRGLCPCSAVVPPCL